jgi:uncharacterized protein YjbI with pentapeptide repeats
LTPFRKQTIFQIKSTIKAFTEGDNKMHEDDVDHDDIDDDEDEDDEDEDDLPELRLEELSPSGDTDEAGPGHLMVIEERMIPSLADIVAMANQNNRPISIEECELAGAEIDAINIDISIDESIFTEDALFENGVFLGKLTFCDVTFDKKVRFGRAIFRGKVHFEDCTFHDTVHFDGATFEKGAVFTFCDFQEETTFDNGTFRDEADLSGSIFRKKVSFKDAVFNKALHLDNVQFKEGLDTAGSNLADMKKEARIQNKGTQKTDQKRMKPKKAEFNPWRELDRVSKKTMSRRDMLRGVFRFLPEKKDE